jgi:hypothetical protein
MKLHPALKALVTGPVITGHKGEVSTPTSFDLAKAFKTVVTEQLSKSQG